MLRTLTLNKEPISMVINMEEGGFKRAVEDGAAQSNIVFATMYCDG